VRFFVVVSGIESRQRVRKNLAPFTRGGAAGAESQLRLPGAHEINLLVGLRDTPPVLRALGLLPQAIQLVEGGFALQTELDQEAADDHAGTADARAAVDIDTAAGFPRPLDAAENLDHVGGFRGGAGAAEG